MRVKIKHSVTQSKSCAACWADEDGHGPCTCTEWEETVSVEAEVRDGHGSIPHYFEVLSVRSLETGRRVLSFDMDALPSGEADGLRDALWAAYLAVEKVETQLEDVLGVVMAQVRLGLAHGTGTDTVSAYLNQVMASAKRAPRKAPAPAPTPLQLVKGRMH